MAKKFLALLLIFFVAANFLSAACAKTPEEKAAAKEAKLQQKREKQLAKVQRKTNIKQVMAWAESGDVQAQMILSYAYATGQRVRHKKNLAIAWQAKVAVANPDLVENFVPLEYYRKKIDLARLYGLAACRSQTGEFVEKNFDDVIRWAELGASEFDTLSLAVLGSAYYTGRGVRQDYKQAIDYLKKAGTEPIALSILSDAYAHGNGVDKNPARSKFYADYLKLISQQKIDRQRDKNSKKIEKAKAKEQERQAK